MGAAEARAKAEAELGIICEGDGSCSFRINEYRKTVGELRDKLEHEALERLAQTERDEQRGARNERAAIVEAIVAFLRLYKPASVEIAVMHLESGEWRELYEEYSRGEPLKGDG